MSAALDFVYPPLCLGCGSARDSSQLLCDRCGPAVQYLDYPICLRCTSPIPTGVGCPTCKDSRPLFALGDHTGPLQQMVIAFKFRNVRGVARWAAEELVARHKDRIVATSAQTLVPIPLYPGREYFRGYNQAELFAEHLADALGLEIRLDLLIRTKHGREQSRLSALDREKNIKGVFEAVPVESPQRGILIVDDVVTSGATVGEAMRTLQAAGHQVVGALAIAHRA
jgi:ComF family protein